MNIEFSSCFKFHPSSRHHPASINLPSVEMTFLMCPLKDYLIADNVLMISRFLNVYIRNDKHSPL